MEGGKRPPGKTGPSPGAVSGEERGETPPFAAGSIICKDAVVAPGSALPGLGKGMATEFFPGSLLVWSIFSTSKFCCK